MRDFKKTIAILVLTIAMGIASGLLLCRLSFNPEGKAILLNYVINPTKYDEQSSELLEKFRELDNLNKKIAQNAKQEEIYKSYLEAKAKADAFVPQEKLLKVTRVASSFVITPETYKKNISNGIIEEQGKGAQKDRYTVIAFNDGSHEKVTTGELSALLPGDRVKRILSLDIIKSNGKYAVTEVIKYKPLY